MDFFARQEAARRQSRWLVVAYALCVLAVIAGVDAGVGFFFSLLRDGYGQPYDVTRVIVFATLATGGLILAASLYKVLLLRGGGGVVARDLGGVRVDPSTADPDQRRLMNVVEEMAIASGVPVPEVYVLEHETAINALSAGHNPSNAAIAVTAGMLRRLSRDQLQGVVAHEFSHILNGDMRLSIRLMGLNFGLLALMLAGRMLLRLGRGGGRGRDDKGNVLMVVAVALLVAGWLGQSCGRLLQAMISRRRERLADAAAVQFTRDRDGLRGALVRAAAQRRSTRLQSADAEEVAHMLFLASGRRWLFATHPPVIERVRALDPGYTGERLREEIVALQIAWDREDAAAKDAAQATTPPAGKGGVADAAGVVGAAGLAGWAAGIAATAGDPRPAHVAHARQVRAALPVALDAIAANPAEARDFVLALLLAPPGPVRDAQLALLARAVAPGLVASVPRLADLAALPSAEHRLAAVLRVFPALRHLPEDERAELPDLIGALAAADRRVEVFEFALGKLVAASLAEAETAAAPHGRLALDEVRAEVALVLAVLAKHGAATEAAARKAYAAGMHGLLGSAHWPDYDCPLAWAGPLSAALDRLRELQPAAKELLVEAMARTLTHDGRISVEEGELMRAVSAVLQCPLPPIGPA